MSQIIQQVGRDGWSLTRSEIQVYTSLVTISRLNHHVSSDDQELVGNDYVSLRDHAAMQGGGVPDDKSEAGACAVPL